MSNPIPVEPDNSFAEAMRTVQQMRGVNQTLRRAQELAEVPPLTPEEAAAAFHRDTGIVVDPATGNVIGKDPNWRPPGVTAGTPPPAGPVESINQQRTRTALALLNEAEAPPPPPVPRPERTPMYAAGAGEPAMVSELMFGVDLDQGLALFEGKEYELTQEEAAVFLAYLTDVVARAMNDKLAALRARLPRAPKQEGDSGQPPAVPEVPPPPAAPGVPAKPRRAARKAKVV